MCGLGDQIAAHQASERSANPGLVDMRPAADFIHRYRLVGAQHHEDPQIGRFDAEPFFESQRADAENHFGKTYDPNRDKPDERVDVGRVLPALPHSAAGIRGFRMWHGLRVASTHWSVSPRTPRCEYRGVASPAQA